MEGFRGGNFLPASRQGFCLPPQSGGCASTKFSSTFFISRPPQKNQIRKKKILLGVLPLRVGEGGLIS